MVGTVRLHCRLPQQEGPPEAVGLVDGVVPAPLSLFWRVQCWAPMFFVMSFICFLCMGVYAPM